MNRIVKTLNDVEILQRARLTDKDYGHLDAFAKNVLAEILHYRFAEKRCSYRQSVLLYKRGYYDAHEWSQIDATKKINEIENNSYKRPAKDGPIQSYDLLIARARRGTESYADGRPDWERGIENGVRSVR